MRIHTDHLTSRDIYNAADTATREGGAPNGRTVRPTKFDLHKSRTRDRAYEVNLTGNNPRRQMGDRDTYAATFDEWGWFLAHLFTVDPSAVAGPYNGATAFHSQTRDAYRTHDIADDPHPLALDTTGEHPNLCLTCGSPATA